METPIYFKEDEAMKPGSQTWPKDEMFFLVTNDGLMKCRNHKFFRSCCKATKFPSELEGQKPFLKIKYPKFPQNLLEQVVGFFSEIEKAHDSEAYICLGWNTKEKKYELICPEQKISGGHVDYDLPTIPPHIMIVGDIHSHVNMSAFASGTDEADEVHRAGIHLVVGRIRMEPPEFHLEAVVDGQRFAVKEELFMEGYEKRSTDFPPEWMAAVSAKKVSFSVGTGNSTGGNTVHPVGSLSGFRSAVKAYEGAENAWDGSAGHD